ncbi:MAG: tetratricopeptide repeat protein [Kofleriaceae bacterium]
MKALVAVVAALALAAGACGGSVKDRIASTGPRPAPKLEPVKPAALREFEAGLRALRLGGPDAPSTARARFEAAIEIDGSLWEAWHALGVIALEAGDDEAAVTAFGKALATNPSHTPSRLARAEAYRAAGDDKQARADYEATLRELAEDDPLRPDAAARLASQLRDEGAYDDAIDVLRETLRVTGATSRVYTELGLVYLAQARLDLAALVLSKAAELDGKDPAVANAQALLAIARGDAQQAFDRFDAATSLDPTYLDARFNKAAVLLDAGDHARAKAELTIVIEKRPTDLDAQVALGVALRGLGDLTGARALWDKVIAGAARRSTARADALFNVAILQIDFLEDIDGGKASLERYLQDAPRKHAKRAAAEEKRKELGL